MITLPEELLTLTQKELEKKLDFKHIKNAKWLYNGTSLINVIHREKDIFLVKDLQSESISTLYDLDISYYQYRILTPTDVKDILKNNLLSLKIKDGNITSMVPIIDRIVKSIYPEEQYDIITVNSSKIALTIHYPEIKITNSLGLEHTMKDIYLKYVFLGDGDSMKICPEMARTSFSYAEYIMSYTFSHLSSNRPYQYANNFCYGGGTAFSRFINELRSYNQKHPITYLAKLLLLFKNYLEWESLEGGPYRLISNLYNRDNGDGNLLVTLPSDYHNHSDSIIKLIFNNVKIKYNSAVSNGINYILITNDTKDEIDKYLDTIVSENWKYFRNKNNLSTTSSDSYFNTYTNLEGKESQVYFKGNYVRIKTEPIPISTNKKVSTVVLQKIIKEIELKITNKIIELKWK